MKTYVKKVLNDGTIIERKPFTLSIRNGANYRISGFHGWYNLKQVLYICNNCKKGIPFIVYK